MNPRYQVIIRVSVPCLSGEETNCGFQCCEHNTEQGVFPQGREKEIESEE